MNLAHRAAGVAALVDGGKHRDGREMGATGSRTTPRWRWTVASYERLVFEPDAEVRRLCRFANLRWDTRIQGALPLTRHTLTPPSPDKWKANETELANVLPSLAATAERAAKVADIRPNDQAVAQASARKERLGSVHTDTVAELLGTADASVMLSTYQSGSVITLRRLDDRLNTHFTSMPKPMGIALSGSGQLAVGTSDEVWQYRGLCMPHSPRCYRDQMWVLESGKGSLSRVDLATGKPEVFATLPGFTRGLAFLGRYALVGLSQVRESVFDGLPLTKGSEPKHSGLWIVDLDSATIVGFVRFDGVVHEIFDVQVDRSPGHLHVVDVGSEQHLNSFVVPDAALAEANAQER